MALTQTVDINFKGGIISPGYLKEVLQLAADARVDTVHFGLRQQLVMEVPVNHFDAFDKACTERQIHHAIKKDALPNIVSSYSATSIFSGDTWLREGVFKDVFNLFDYAPHLKINICDSTQQLVPFFTGHINWISSSSPHFWYLYIRAPKTQTAFCWRELIYTNDIAAVSKQVERLMLADTSDETGLYLKVKNAVSYTAKPVDKTLQLQTFSLPYYEGLNKENNTWWLGIYRREEAFTIAFLNDVCDLCLQTKIGELYTTPWKSLIIKSIEGNHRVLWNKVLGKHRINVRHAANELNWQVEDEGLIIKRLIIRHFDKEDVRTQGLCFAVQTKPYSSLFGSVIIRKEQVKNPHRLRSLDRYSILYKEGFNPNAAPLILFRESVEKEYLGIYLVSLFKYYYEQENGTPDFIQQPVVSNSTTEEKPLVVVYQCRHCFTVYDEACGDEEQAVTAGTAFTALPIDYRCPTCEATKDDFTAVDRMSLQLAY